MADAPLEVLDFWWRAGPERWFKRDAAFDAAIAQRFGALHAEAVSGKLAAWAVRVDGALALILVLDQFSRNLYRDDARGFAQDPAALDQAERAIAQGFDRAYPNPYKRFFYMPFMHAESLAAQQRCIDLCRAAHDEEGVHFALLHMDVICRFGRFPHRNAILNRSTTAAEQAFLDAGGFHP